MMSDRHEGKHEFFLFFFLGGGGGGGGVPDCCNS